MFKPLFHGWSRKQIAPTAKVCQQLARIALVMLGLAASVPTFAVGTGNVTIGIPAPATPILDTQTSFITVNVNNPTAFGTTPTGGITLIRTLNGAPISSIVCNPLQEGAQTGKASTTCSFGPNAAAGDYTYVANYSGDAVFAAKSSSVVNQTIVKTWALTLVADANGSIALNGAPFTSGNTVRIAQTAIQNIVVTPASNFHFSQTQASCGPTTPSNGPANVAFTSSSAFDRDCTITWSFSDQRTTTLFPNGDGTGSVSGIPLSVTEGSSITVVVNPDSNSEVDFIAYKPVGGPVTTQNFLAGVNFSTGAKSKVIGPYLSNYEVAVGLTAVTRVAVQGAAGPGGSISPVSVQVPINTGSFTQFTATANPGFQFAGFSGCGAGSTAGNVYSTAAITAACTVTASFTALPTFTVTATAGSGGTITPATRAVLPGDTTTFTVTPNTGFSISSVSGCGGTAGNSSPYTTGPINAPCTVSATFVAQINGVCGSASSAVGVGTAPSANLCSTGTATLVATNVNNFTWGCNGSNGGTSTSATACSVPRSYVVTGSAGAGGGINCTSPVNGGNSTSCTLTPNANFIVSTVTGCSGTYVPGSASFTTGPITAPCTVTATFVATAPVTITENPADQSVVAGNTANFTAAASGTPPPTVLWSRSNDGGANYVPIAGATATTYGFIPVIADGGSLYRATFGNGFTSATTTPAVLTVSYGPILNIDNSDATTKYHPATDGVLLLRYLLGLRGSALIANARGTGAGLRDAAAIEAHLAANLSLLDVDGDAQTLPLTDGVMILRRLLNPTALASDAAASAAITAGAKRGALSDEAVVKAIDALKP